MSALKRPKNVLFMCFFVILKNNINRPLIVMCNTCNMIFNFDGANFHSIFIKGEIWLWIWLRRWQKNNSEIKQKKKQTNLPIMSALHLARVGTIDYQDRSCGLTSFSSKFQDDSTSFAFQRYLDFYYCVMHSSFT